MFNKSFPIVLSLVLQIFILFSYGFTQQTNNTSPYTNSPNNNQNTTNPSPQPYNTAPTQTVPNNTPPLTPTPQKVPEKPVNNSTPPTVQSTVKPNPAPVVEKKNPPSSPINKIITQKKVTKEEPVKQASSNDKIEEKTENKQPTALENYFSNSSNPANTPNTSPITPSTEIPSAWGPFFFLTVLVLGVYFLILFFKKKWLRFKVSNSPITFIKTVASVPVTAHSQLAIVDIAGKFFLFGITTHSMEMIMEIKDYDLIMKIQTIPENITPKSFKEIFTEIFISRNTKKIEAPSTEESLKQFIEKQKNRIGNIK